MQTYKDRFVYSVTDIILSVIRTAIEAWSVKGQILPVHQSFTR